MDEQNFTNEELAVVRDIRSKLAGADALVRDAFEASTGAEMTDLAVAILVLHGALEQVVAVADAYFGEPEVAGAQDGD